MTDPKANPSPFQPLRLAPEAAASMRSEIARARGREVTFLMEVDEDRVLRRPRAVARGNRGAVLAASRDAAEGSVMIHNHPSGDLEPSSADLAVAASLYETGVGSAIVDNGVTDLYVVVEPPTPRVLEPLDLDVLEAFLGPEGPFADAHPAFEDREGQREMAVFTARVYNDGGVGLVEAGTGTGKSIAYLLPAVSWALENGERTVVSTNTINLQEQLVGKDLPLLAEALGKPVRWSLVKGRGNYVSIRRAHLAAASSASLFPDDRGEELAAILDWIETTEDGSLADLANPPSDEVWEEVQSDPDICLRTRCPHFQQCFFQRARREAASAEILVVNHHLLFTDLAVRRLSGNFTQAAVLPPYRRLIVDEAHHAEAAATDHLGVGVTRQGIHRLLSRLERRGKGVLADIEENFLADPERGASEVFLTRLADRVRPALKEAKQRVEPFLDSLSMVMEDGQGFSMRLGGRGGTEPRELDSVRESMDALTFSLRVLAREVGEIRVRIQDDEEWAEVLEGRSLDLFGAQARLENYAHAIERVLDPGDQESAFVRWMERKGKRGNLALAAAPIEVGPILREDLFQRIDTVVLTSATLTTRTGFQHLRGRLGLDAEELEAEGSSFRVSETVVPSPFDFESQSLLAVPTGLTGPGESGQRFEEETATLAAEVADLTGGGLFVLFTSYRALDAVAKALRKKEAEGRFRFPMFVQGEGPRHRLLQQFVESGKGVLLGTSSFWEGVDVPGDPLRALILQKLPFHVPTEPIIAARYEVMEARGEDPFWLYSLPEAALRLKQGFGRLIRTRDDRGVVLVLDDRILTRRYGMYLRQSLPPAPFLKGLWPDIRRGLEEFYRGQ